MNKTIFQINKMDCPSEEQIIRMKLDGLANIKSLDFDIANRQLTVFHSDSSDQIFQRLDSLKLDTTILSSVTINDFAPADDKQQQQKLLWIVFFINFGFFLIEIVTGFIANSMGLVADSLDMLADSIVYSLALFAVGGTMTRKKNIAKAGGFFQMTLAIMGLVEVIRRFLDIGEIPAYQTMIVISAFALIGNSISLYLLQKSKSKEAHMQASMIFTSNDVIVNIGVIAAGGLVYLTNSKLPDLIIGTLVFAIVAKGAIRILKL